MIKDFVPARASVATGAIVKQHLLERNRQRPAQINYIQPEYTGSFTSLARNYQTGSIEVFTGGAGGSVNILTNISQSWSSSILTKAGLVDSIQSSQYEFFNGEYSGSNIPCHLSYSLNTTPLLNNVSGSRLSTIYEDVDYSTDALNPVNLRYIQSSSANLAPVQDSNYSSGSAWSNARYAGSENTGQYNYNIAFQTGSLAPGYPIDRFSNYIAVFDWIGGSNPEYPGGGNIHIITLIDIYGNQIGLDGSNNNLETVEQLFKQGTNPTIYIQSYSSNQSVGTVEIVTGGALIDTVLLRSGSNPGFLYVGWSNNTNSGHTSYLISSSLSQLVDSASVGDTGFLYVLQNKTSPSNGTNLYFYPGSGVQIFNKTKGLFVAEGTSDYRVSYDDTYFPLQYGDFIRFGNTGSYSYSNTGSLDDTFTGAGLYNIYTVATGSNFTETGSIQISPTLTGEVSSLVTLSNIANQNYRILRRVPNETFVLIKKKPPYAGGGILIPFNFNPNYNPLDVARQAGIQI
jgi:hypothetical protein